MQRQARRVVPDGSQGRSRVRGSVVATGIMRGHPARGDRGRPGWTSDVAQRGGCTPLNIDNCDHCWKPLGDQEVAESGRTIPASEHLRDDLFIGM